VHAAAGWLLRAWGRSSEVAQIDEVLKSEGIVDGRNWYVNRLGMCMVIVRGPTVFTMGSPSAEANRHAHEALHDEQLDHSFAISTREVTFADLQALGVEAVRDTFRAPSADCPVSNLNWDDISRILLAMSELEDLDEVAPMTIGDDATWQIDLRREGYRLPTSAEWEVTCRAGTRSSRFFGSQFTGFEERYAWYTQEERLSESATRMPNQWGLFDCYGNVHEWVIGRHRIRSQETEVHAPEGGLLINSNELAMHRGGSYQERPGYFRSAWWTPTQPSRRFDSVGFRIARTLEWSQSNR
jgi:formylglycine-generating enzyme required for sulfatase activity